MPAVARVGQNARERRWVGQVVVGVLVLLIAGPPFLASYWVGLLTQMLIFALLAGSVETHDIVFPRYRLFVMFVASIVGVLLWALNEHTLIGAKLRATVDDPEMAAATGINVALVSGGVFAAGAGLAAFGGVMGGPILGGYAGMDLDLLPLAFVVVIIGGMGSLKGALVGSIAVGLIDNFGKALVPELSYFTLFAPMVIVLAIKPTGLYGRG